MRRPRELSMVAGDGLPDAEVNGQNGNRSGRGQVGPCLTDVAHRPLPERRPCVSRYASARTLQKAVTAANFAGGVIISPLPRGQRNCWPMFKLCRARQSVKAPFVTKNGGRPDLEPEASFIGTRLGTQREYCRAHRRRARNLICKNRRPFLILQQGP
jgi:hypothetical protein